jgi:hypothetical protein
MIGCWHVLGLKNDLTVNYGGIGTSEVLDRRIWVLAALLKLFIS